MRLERYRVRLLLSVILLGIASARSLAEDDPAQAEPEQAAETAEAAVSFRNDIAPILANNCLACHGGDEPQGEYQLFNFEHLMKEGYSTSPIVTPGKPDESELFLLVSQEDESLRMPKESDPLPAEQVALIKRWIEQGAKFDGGDPTAALASLLPRAAHPAAPESYRVAIPVTALAFRPDGQELTVGGYHEVTIWNAADGTLVRRIGNVGERVYGLDYRGDGSLLAVAAGTPGQSGEISLLDPASGELVRSLVTMSDVAFDVVFSPDGTKLAGCGADRTIRIFDVESGAEEVLIEDHADWVMSIAFNHDGTRIASASRDKTSKVFDAKTGDSQTTYPGHGEAVFGVAWNADGTQVITSGADKKIHVWNPADANKIADIGGFGHEVYKVLFRNGQILSCSADNSVQQHAAEDRKPVRKYAGHEDWVYDITYNDATKRLASGGYNGRVRIWNAEDGANLLTFVAAPGYTPPADQQAAAK